MRNRFRGTCYRCGETVEPGAGHFEKIMGIKNGWRIQHAECAVAYRGRNQAIGELLPRPKQEEARR